MVLGRLLIGCSLALFGCGSSDTNAEPEDGSSGGGSSTGEPTTSGPPGSSSAADDDSGTTGGTSSESSSGVPDTGSTDTASDDSGSSESDTDSGSESSSGTDTGGKQAGYQDEIEVGPDLAVGRMHHVAVLLDDGTVFVGGGYSGDQTITSIEVYRPEEGDVVDAGALLHGRFDACAVKLLDGRVLVVGGAVSNSDLWDPETLQTVAGPQLDYGVGHPMCMITEDGTVLVADSYVAGKGYLIEAWSPGDEAFEPWLESNTPLSFGGGHDGALVGDGGGVLLVGGSWDFGKDPPPGSDVAQLFDLTAQTYDDAVGWTGQGRILVEANGDALLYRSGTEAFVAARFDATTGTITDLSPASAASSVPMAELRDDGIAVVAGGLVIDDDGNSVHTDQVWRWDADAQELQEVASLSVPRFRGTTTRLDDGRIAIIGGATGGTYSTAIDIYY